jgi:hypothetical protein
MVAGRGQMAAKFAVSAVGSRNTSDLLVFRFSTTKIGCLW